MTFVKGEGQLRHQFFGRYSARIAIGFSDMKSALSAIDFLVGKWEAIENNGRVGIVFEGSDPELKKVLDQLEEFGAPKEKVSSLKYSVDYGEIFEVTIPVTAKEQEKLWGRILK